MDCKTELIEARADLDNPPSPAAGGFAAMLQTSGAAAGVCWTALLDELSYGFVVVETDGRILFANRVAGCELANGPGLRQVGGYVKAISPRADEFLAAAIARAGRGRRGYVNLVDAGDSAGCAVVPVPSATDAATVHVALILERREKHCELGYQFYSQAHGLTPVEHRVMVTLAGGVGVQQVSTDLGSAISTVRTHVRNLLAKTRQPSLRALVARLGAIPPVGARVVR